MCVSDLHADISDSLYLDDTAKTEHDEGTDERLEGVRVYGSSHLCFFVVRPPPILLYLCHCRRAGAYRVDRTRRPHFLLLPPTKEEVHVFARVRLSVCRLARLLKNACMDLHEMLRVVDFVLAVIVARMHFTTVVKKLKE